MSPQEPPFPSIPFHDLLFGPEPVRWVQDFVGLGYPTPFEVFSMLGDTWGLMFVVGLALWLWGRRVAYPVAGLVVLGGLTKEVMNLIFTGIPRPQGSGIVVYEHLATTSFPSGHVYEGLSPWGLLWVYDRVPLAVPILVGVLVSAGRLYLASHWLGDVLAGLVLGVVLVAVFPPLWRAVEGWLRARSFGFYVGAGTLAVVGMAVNLYFNSGNAHRWEVAGFGAGMVAGLLLEYRYVGYAPREGEWRRQALKVVAGLAGIAGLAVAHRVVDEETPAVLALLNVLGALWAVLAAPALFRQLDRRRDRITGAFR